VFYKYILRIFSLAHLAVNFALKATVPQMLCYTALWNISDSFWILRFTM